MLDFLASALNAVFALVALVSVALFLREVVIRVTAGPVRFRLGSASPATPWAGRATSLLDPMRGLRLRSLAAYGWVRMFLLLAMLSIPFSITSRLQLIEGSRLMLLIALAQCALSFRLARRDIYWWPVLASGLFSLATGAVVLAVEFRALQAGGPLVYLPREAFLLVGSAAFVLIGAAVIQDSIRGTKVRERGIAMFCTTQPWSRIVVKGWYACEDAFLLHLTLLPPRLLGVQLEIDNEIVVPVSASQRPRWKTFSRTRRDCRCITGRRQSVRDSRSDLCV